MNLSLPSDRNFEVYHEVKMGGLSLRAAAKVFGVSAHRVQEICQQVEAWYAANMADWARSYDPETQAVAAWRKNLLVLDQLFTQTMRAWHGATEPEPIETPKSGEPIRREDFGQSRYVNLAARLTYQKSLVATAMAKLPREWFERAAKQDAETARLARLAGDIMSASSAEEMLQAADAAHVAEEVSDVRDVNDEACVLAPAREPEGVCSPPVRVFAPHTTSDAPSANEAEVVTEDTTVVCDDFETLDEEAEVHKTDDSDPLRSRRQTRRERKKRARLLEQALAKSREGGSGGGGKRLAKMG
jgi:hypothetical protein